MIDQLRAIGERALQELGAAASLDALEQVRISVLGKKGSLSEVLKGLGSVSAEERPKIGAAANEWKQKIESALDARKSALERAALDAQLAGEKLDISLPVRAPHKGSL